MFSRDRKFDHRLNRRISYLASKMDTNKITEIRLPQKVDSLRYLKNNGLVVKTILDVGVQRETRELKEVFPEVKHLLFEPVEEYHARIEENYLNFDYTLIKCALSDADGEDFLKIKKMGSETVTHSTLGNWLGEDFDEKRIINIFALDTVIKNQSCLGPYLLKLDVDGHEIPILKGAEETLKSCACIVIETPLCYLSERVNYLTKKGFELWDIVDLCYYYNNLHQVDLIFLNGLEKQKAPFSPWQNFEFKWEEWKELSRKML